MRLEDKRLKPLSTRMQQLHPVLFFVFWLFFFCVFGRVLPFLGWFVCFLNNMDLSHFSDKCCFLNFFHYFNCACSWVFSSFSFHLIANVIQYLPQLWGAEEYIRVRIKLYHEFHSYSFHLMYHINMQTLVVKLCGLPRKSVFISTIFNTFFSFCGISAFLLTSAPTGSLL